MKTASLTNLSECTPTEVFATIARHLLTQNARAATESVCHYRTESGLKCAAGCLIPDNVYNSEFEGATWAHLVMTYVVPRFHSSLILNLQRIHDQIEPAGWPHALERAAREWCIDPTVLDDVLESVHESS